MLDSSDRERLSEARDELHKVLSSQNLEEQVLLVLANKSDLPGTMSNDEIANKLGLDTMTQRSWRTYKFIYLFFATV